MTSRIGVTARARSDILGAIRHAKPTPGEDQSDRGARLVSNGGIRIIRAPRQAMDPHAHFEGDALT